MGIYTPEHERLRGIVLEQGALYKPSGAGGGDFGIALSDSRAGSRELRKALESGGYRCLDADLCAPGLTITGSGKSG